jgi:hypothetical protein
LQVLTAFEGSDFLGKLSPFFRNSFSFKMSFLLLLDLSNCQSMGNFLEYFSKLAQIAVSYLKQTFPPNLSK